MVHPDGSPIDRGEAFGRLEAELRLARAGAARIALLTGEAGIGKTFVLDAATERFVHDGCYVLVARAQDYDSGIAYATLREALAGVAAGTGHDDAVLSTVAALTDAIDGLYLDDPSNRRDGGQHSLYAMTTRLLEALTRSQPTVVVVDDVHLADAETLTALSMSVRYLSRRPLLVVAAARHDALAADSVPMTTLGRLVDGHGCRIDLAPLGRSATRDLVQLLLGEVPDDAMVAYVHGHTMGNPLYVRETLLRLRAGGALRSEHGRCFIVDVSAATSVSRRGALLHRVFQQDADARVLARVLAPFRRVQLEDLEVLEHLAQMSPSRLSRAFDGLVIGGIVVTGSDGHYRFVHPLMAEVLYDDLGPAERRRLHSRIADHLRAGRATVNPLELATHVAEAAEPGDVEAVKVLVEAGEIARHTAPLTAASWYERALALLPPGAPERPELLARRCVLLWKGSRLSAAITAGRAALDELPPGRRRDRTLRTVITATYAAGRYQEALDLMTAEAVPPGEAEALLAQRALLLVERHGSSAEVEHARRRAWKTVEDSERPDLTTVTHLGHMANDLGDFGAAVRAADILLEHSPGLSASAQLSAVESAAYVLTAAGCVRRAETLLHQAANLGEQVGWHDMGGQQHYAAALWNYLSGRWDAADAEISSGAVALEAAGLESNRAWLRLLEAQLATERGRLDEAAALLDTQVPGDSGLQRAIQRCARAGLALVTRADESTIAVLEGQRAASRASGWAFALATSLELLADAYVRLGDRSRALAAADELAAVAARCQSPRLVCMAGRVVSAVSQQPEPAQHALAVAIEHGLVVAEARLQLVLGTIGDDPGANLGRAHQRFQALGAVLWRQRASAEMRRQGITTIRRVVRGESGDSLTSIERQLVGLVQQGLTNREIAAALHYSVKTVEAYLGRVYAKTGCRTRIDLVRAVERGDVVAHQ